MDHSDGHHAHSESLPALAIGAIGVVFGDIGTSPLYALKESFIGHHPLTVDKAHVFGVLSLIFWTMLLIVTIKYVLVIMRADNKGEGGSLALLALIGSKLGVTRWTPAIAMLGVIATEIGRTSCAKPELMIVSPSTAESTEIAGVMIASP